MVDLCCDTFGWVCGYWYGRLFVIMLLCESAFDVVGCFAGALDLLLIVLIYLLWFCVDCGWWLVWCYLAWGSVTSRWLYLIVYVHGFGVLFGYCLFVLFGDLLRFVCYLGAICLSVWLLLLLIVLVANLVGLAWLFRLRCGVVCCWIVVVDCCWLLVMVRL